jgi:hypothetical protein
MNKSAILEIFYKYDYVTYYTVRLLEEDDEPAELSETDKFYERFDDPGNANFNEFDTISRIIDAIGCWERGAEDFLFRFEDAANALPSKRGHAKKFLGIEVIEDSELRLYCIRLTNQIVILLNGGMKTQDQALACPNVREHFRFAQAVSKSINTMLIEKSIVIAGKLLINKTMDDQLILYL